MDLIERKQRFCIKWEIRRKRKWKNYFSVFYSLVHCYVTHICCNNQSFQIRKCFLKIGNHSLCGFWSGWIICWHKAI